MPWWLDLLGVSGLLGTIGYGVMHPLSAAAEALVTAEVIVGVSLVALASGILFAKFSVPRARMQFAEWATISPFDGVPFPPPGR